MHTYVYFDSLLDYEDGEWGLVIMDWVMQQFHYTSAPSNDPRRHRISAGKLISKLCLSC